MVQRRSDKMDARIVKLEENFDVKFNDHKEGMNAFIQNVFAEFKEEMKKNVFETIFISKKRACFSSRFSLKSVMCTSESNIEELDQYGRRLSERIENVLVVENETSEDVFNNVLDMCKKEKFNISVNDIGRSHRIGKLYVNNISKNSANL